MTAWYRDVLGVDFGDHGLWQQPAGPTVIGLFEADTDYFSTAEGQDRQPTMLNFRVGDLDAMIAQLRETGAEVDDQTQQMDGIRRFG